MDSKKMNVLMIGAHPDDCEFMTGGTAAKYSALGHKVKFVSMTNGNAGHHEMGGAELALRRREEAELSAKVIGIQSEIMDIDDGSLEVNLQNRKKVIKLIRDFKPDLIFTNRPNDYHPDHRYTSTLVQDAVFMSIVPNICPFSEALKKMPIVIYVADDFKKPVELIPDVAVCIDDVIGLKNQMLNCHKSQVYEWLPWIDGVADTVPQDEGARILWLKEDVIRRGESVANRFREKLTNRYGEEKGKLIKCAEVFEVSEYGSPLPAEYINTYFPF